MEGFVGGWAGRCRVLENNLCVPKGRSDSGLSGSHFHDLTVLGPQTVSLCCGSPALSQSYRPMSQLETTGLRVNPNPAIPILAM